MRLNRKNKFLVVGFCLLLYVCYEFAFSGTIKYYHEYRELNELLSNNSADEAFMQKMIAKEKQLNLNLKPYTTAGGESFQNDLLKELSKYSQQFGLRIVDFREPHIFAEKEIKNSSYVFSLQGSFNGILLLINKLENNPSLGVVKHISFIKKRNYKTNVDYLTAEIILQKSETITD